MQILGILKININNKKKEEIHKNRTHFSLKSNRANDKK